MAKQSLAAQTPGALAQELKLPSIFQAPSEPVKARYIAPYISFVHPKRSDEWARVKGAAEGDMYLIESDRVLALPQAKLTWLAHKQYWAEANAVGEVQRTSYEERPQPWKEHIEAVVLLYLEDRIVPCNVQFRTTKCGGAQKLSSALAEAATMEWGEKSPAHKESMVCAQPYARFYGVVELGPTRTSKNGPTYRPLVCSIYPTSVSEWRLFKALSEDPATQKRLDDAARWFEHRVSEVEKKLVK